MERPKHDPPLSVEQAKARLLAVSAAHRQRMAGWIREAPLSATLGSLLSGVAVGMSRQLLMVLAEAAIVFLRQMAEACARTSPPDVGAAEAPPDATGRVPRA